MKMSAICLFVELPRTFVSVKTNKMFYVLSFLHNLQLPLLSMPWNSDSEPAWWRMPAGVSMMTASGTLLTGYWKIMVASSTLKRFLFFGELIFCIFDSRWKLWFKVRIGGRNWDGSSQWNAGKKLIIQQRIKIANITV